MADDASRSMDAYRDSVRDLSAAVDGAEAAERGLTRAGGDTDSLFDVSARTAAVLAEATRTSADTMNLLAAAEDALISPSERVTNALLDQTSELGKADDAVTTITHHYGLCGTVISALTAKVPLFGGALDAIPLMGEVAGWHLLADAVVETTAVWVPAAIAFSAFGAAALPTVQDIYTQMKNLNTVSEATGQQIPGLTGNFSRLSEAVRPEVYDLFGEALQTITHNGGAFSTMAEGAGQVLDQLGARMEVAVTDGHGLSGFATTAVSDLGKLTNSIGNVVGIFGDFLKVVPGYAGILLGLGDSATHVAEDFTTVAEPVLKAGLALHGAIIYGGLAATAVAAAMRGGLTMIGNWAEKAAMAAGDSDMLGGALSKAAPAMFSFSAGAAEAAALPWGWITLAAAGFGVLAYEMLTTKDATTQWLDAQQSALGEASAGVKGFTQLQEDQAQVTTRLAFTTQHYGLTVAQANHAVNDMGGSFQVTARSIQDGAKSISEMSTGQKILSDQTSLYQGRLGKLGAEYGSVSAAQGLLSASGIKMSEMLDKSSGAWAQIQAQIGGLVAAYREMGQQGGTLGADMNALTIAGSDQVSAMSNLNKAWDNTIAITSGGQNAFISFQQALSSSAVGSAKLDSSIGSLSIAMKASGASMTGLNAPSLALRSAWQGAYGAGEQLTDALRMMSSVSPGGFPSITKAMKDTIAEMMPLGKQSGATRAELVQMAQEIDPNIHNFQQLTQWLGNTKNAGQDLNKILTQAGTNLDDLAAAASKLSNAMQSDVTAQMAQAKLAANGTDTAISNLATAMNTAGTSAATQHGDMVKLYDDLRQDGYGAQQAQAMIESMTGAIFRIPHSAHTDVHQQRRRRGGGGGELPPCH